MPTQPELTEPNDQEDVVLAEGQKIGEDQISASSPEQNKLTLVSVKSNTEIRDIYDETRNVRQSKEINHPTVCYSTQKLLHQNGISNILRPWNCSQQPIPTNFWLMNTPYNFSEASHPRLFAAAVWYKPTANSNS